MSNFLSNVIGRFGEAPQSRPSAVPGDLRIYAIGDVQGYSDLLGRLAGRIEADLRQNRPDRALAIFVGDYIDRGPDSAGVIERLATGGFPIPFETLRGNHEDMMMRAMVSLESMDHWCQSGGIETLQSYGIDMGARPSLGNLIQAQQDIIQALPDAHLQFLEETRLTREVGDYFFVHAGVRPGVALDRQRTDDLLWIRDEFLMSDYDFGKTIVHGHTPHRRPENQPRRINVDTGAFRWGVLTCVALDGTRRRFLSTRE